MMIQCNRVNDCNRWQCSHFDPHAESDYWCKDLEELCEHTNRMVVCLEVRDDEK